MAAVRGFEQLLQRARTNPRPRIFPQLPSSNFIKQPTGTSSSLLFSPAKSPDQTGLQPPHHIVYFWLTYRKLRPLTACFLRNQRGMPGECRSCVPPRNSHCLIRRPRDKVVGLKSLPLDPVCPSITHAKLELSIALSTCPPHFCNLSSSMALASLTTPASGSRAPSWVRSLDIIDSLLTAQAGALLPSSRIPRPAVQHPPHNQDGQHNDANRLLRSVRLLRQLGYGIRRQRQALEASNCERDTLQEEHSLLWDTMAGVRAELDQEKQARARAEQRALSFLFFSLFLLCMLRFLSRVATTFHAMATYQINALSVVLRARTARAQQYRQERDLSNEALAALRDELDKVQRERDTSNQRPAALTGQLESVRRESDTSNQQPAALTEERNRLHSILDSVLDRLNVESTGFESDTPTLTGDGEGRLMASVMALSSRTATRFSSSGGVRSRSSASRTKALCAEADRTSQGVSIYISFLVEVLNANTRLLGYVGYSRG